MFEVGKKYKRGASPNLGSIFEPLFVGTERTFIRYADGVEITIDNAYYGQYIEHKEPRKFVKYINVYEDGYIGCSTDARIEADSCAGRGRIACIRVEATEGQFDD